MPNSVIDTFQQSNSANDQGGKTESASAPKEIAEDQLEEPLAPGPQSAPLINDPLARIKVVFSYRKGFEEAGLNVYVDSESFVHVGFRPAEKTIVLNTCVDGAWGEQANIVGSFEAGQYELILDFSPAATLLFDLVELISVSLTDRNIALSPRLHKIAVSGDAISVLTPDGEYHAGSTFASQVTQSGDSELAQLLRGQREGLIETLSTFDYRCYVDLNLDLRGRFQQNAEAIVHFLRHGMQELRQFSDAEIFDLQFYQARYEDIEPLSPAEGYEHWLSVGRSEGRSCSEKMWLKRLGLSTPEIPPSFTAEGYADFLIRSGLSVPADSRSWAAADRATPTIPARGHFANKWDAFEHWTDHIQALPDLSDSTAFAVIYKEIAETRARTGRTEAALGLYSRAVLLSNEIPEIWQHFGDFRLRQSDFAAAHHAYSRVIALGAASYWTYRNQILAKRGLGEIRPALEAASALAKTFPERAEPRELIGDIARDLFELNREQAKLRAIAGRKNEACAQIRSIFGPPELPTAPAAGARAAGGPSRVLIFGTPYLPQCMFYRIEQKLEQLRLAGFEADFIPQNEPLRFMSRAGACDVAIFYRVPASPLIESAILYCREIGVTTFYEIDDLIFDSEYFPDSLESYRGALTPEEYANLVVDTPLYERAMSLCEFGIASTPALQLRMESLVTARQCFLHRNVMDARHERFVEAIAAQGPKSAEEVLLFYATGTKAHNEDFEVLAAPAIAKLLEREPRLGLFTMGYLPLPEVLRPFESRITQLAPNWDVTTFWSVLANMDINLSVVKASPFSDCKSEIKWIEASMLGVPSVLSSNWNYTDILTDGREAMLADSVETWEHKLSLLVESRALRTKVGNAARQLVLSAYSAASGVENIAEIVRSGLKSRPARNSPQAQKPLILLVNVFFWPQMIGGATRVVKDNLDYFCDHFGSEFDFQVFCGVDGARTPYETRTYFYRDVRVTSVTYPMRAGMDWLPADEAIGDIFRSHLEHWKPSLIHFHGIQRLSVCIAEAAREWLIPYVVTTHDGWWISDHQFLVDNKGKVVPDEPPGPIERLREAGTESHRSISRSIRLHAALAGAERVLAVSPAFEQVYRRHGVSKNIVTVENGVSDLSECKPCTDDDGRVRLGYLGNISDHKGYGLIRRALLSTEFTNLSLTVVDHGLNYRESRPPEIWGTTPVRTIGKVPQANVMELYGALHVLLAPSIWPESYGLVAREATMAGLWVVASNRGAIGSDVTRGMNGFVIDVADAAELVAVLKQIDQNPAKYRSAPAVGPRLRKAEEQAEHLARLYRQILSGSPCAEETD